MNAPRLLGAWGADMTLTKPFTEEEMIAAIGELLDTGEVEAGAGNEAAVG